MNNTPDNNTNIPAGSNKRSSPLLKVLPIAVLAAVTAATVADPVRVAAIAVDVAVAETEAQDSHQTLVLGVVTVANESGHVHSQLSKVLAMVEASTADELVRADMDVFGA